MVSPDQRTKSGPIRPISLQISWSGRADAPATLRMRIGDWPSGLYYAELDAPDGRVGYAPFVVRPAELGEKSRIAVVLPTSTWPAIAIASSTSERKMKS